VPTAEPVPGVDFDPYRFGAPEHPIPPEYAPPGYTPPPVPPLAPPTPPAGEQNPWAVPPPTPPNYAGGQPGAPTQSGYPGQPYPGQPYPGQQQGQPYPGQPYPGQPYPGQPYTGQPYPGQQPYTGYQSGQQPPQQQYPQGYWYPQPSSGPGGKAIVALIAGIASIVFFWTTFFDLIPIVLAIVFGIVAISEARRRAGRPGHNIALAGVICGLVGLLFATIFSVWFFSAVNDCGGVSSLDNSDYSNSVFSDCLQNQL
jgi:hypothetical protein